MVSASRNFSSNSQELKAEDILHIQCAPATFLLHSIVVWVIVPISNNLNKLCVAGKLQNTHVCVIPCNWQRVQLDVLASREGNQFKRD